MEELILCKPENQQPEMKPVLTRFPRLFRISESPWSSSTGTSPIRCNFTAVFEMERKSMTFPSRIYRCSSNSMMSSTARHARVFMGTWKYFHGAHVPCSGAHPRPTASSELPVGCQARGRCVHIWICRHIHPRVQAVCPRVPK